MSKLNAISLAIILAWLVPHACLEEVPPHRIGVRKSVEGGVAEEDFMPGWHLSLPFLHSWYQLDGVLQYMEFHDDSATALEVRTKENNIIYIDCVIVFRIKPGEAWKIVREGFADSYPNKVRSAASGELREVLADLTSVDVQDPEKREAATLKALPRLNEAVAQYHIEVTHVTVRAIRFRPQYEEKLQNKQFFVVQGKLDEALQRQSKAAQETETLEKTVDKDIALKTEEWNAKIETERKLREVEIADITAQAMAYDRTKRAEADAIYVKALAEGDLAEAKAQALGEKLRSEALVSKAGLTFSAIEAVRAFKLGDMLLNSSDPTFLERCCSMDAWRRFFLADDKVP
jgi:regulator of protease activity HflC (stomatin/prohibitin superfamily)